jgi:predicted CXXCH cytochrome family protein
VKTWTNHLKHLFILSLVGCGWLCVTSQAGASDYSFGQKAGNDQACLGCHADSKKVKAQFLIDTAQYDHTTHAGIGCAACHGPVAANHPAGLNPRPECRECHAEVSAEYAGSIHAGKTTCAGCHNPHKVVSPTEISGERINAMCAGCHDRFEMIAKHSEWLSQADLHLRMLPCITCHTASKEYFISMYVVKGKDGSRFGKQELATFNDLKKLANGRDILSLIDTNGDKFVSLNELKAFNRDGSHRYLRLKGMMTPQTVTHSFDILDSRRNCVFCHASGPAPMQTSFLTLPEANGTFSRVPVEKGAIFDALYGAPDFYMMGSTKNGTLNVIGLAIICGGLIMPVGHGSLRFLTRKNRKGKEH